MYVRYYFTIIQQITVGRFNTFRTNSLTFSFVSTFFGFRYLLSYFFRPLRKWPIREVILNALHKELHAQTAVG